MSSDLATKVPPNPPLGKEGDVETKSMDAVASGVNAAFIFVDLRESDGWEKLEDLLAEARSPAVDAFVEEVSPQDARWHRQ